LTPQSPGRLIRVDRIGRPGLLFDRVFPAGVRDVAT